MFNWFKKQKQFFGTGVLEDDRIIEEKQKDYQLEEVAMVAPIEWKEKSQNEWKRYPIFNQDGSLSCLSYAVAKCLSINNFIEEKEFIRLSARDIYTRRYNKPHGGMFCYDASEIARKYGATLENLMPSEGMNEILMNNISDRTPSKEVIARIYKANSWIRLNNKDIDEIAGVLKQEKPVLLAFKWASYAEWDQPVPTIIGGELRYAHAITGIDYTLYQGKKAIIIEDSWGSNKGMNGQRIITEEWFKQRSTWASYFEDLNNFALLNPIKEKPKYQFTKILKLGMKDKDIFKLKECLGYLQDETGILFPYTESSTDYYGGITRQAVKRYQKMKGLNQTGEVDEWTLKELNKDFK